MRTWLRQPSRRKPGRACASVRISPSGDSSSAPAVEIPSSRPRRGPNPSRSRYRFSARPAAELVADHPITDPTVDVVAVRGAHQHLAPEGAVVDGALNDPQPLRRRGLRRT